MNQMKFTITFEIEGMPEGHDWQPSFIEQVEEDIFNALEEVEISIPERFNRDKMILKTIKPIDHPTLHCK